MANQSKVNWDGRIMGVLGEGRGKQAHGGLGS